jgi:hypothetical protein
MKPVARVGRRGKQINGAVPEDGTMVDGLQFCVMPANRLCGVDSFFRISSNVQGAGRGFESLQGLHGLGGRESSDMAGHYAARLAVDEAPDV